MEPYDEKYYMRVAVNLLDNGTVYQMKCIRYYIRTFVGSKRMAEIKNFIDIEFKLGKIEG